MLLAGTSITDISPRPGLELAGYPHHPRNNTGIHDPLFASCLYINDGSTSLEIICMDLALYSRNAVKRVRAEICRQCGIPELNILICCSHTHSAPWPSDAFDIETSAGEIVPDSQYMESVFEKLVALGVAAQENPFNARIGIEKTFCGREKGVGGNRLDPNELADPEVWVIGVKDDRDKLRCVLGKYSLHPTFIHSDSTLVSADYPGYMRKYLMDRYPEMVFLFAQGTSGNQSPRFFRSGKTFDEARRVGETLGESVDEVLKAMTFSGDLPLGVVSEDVDIEVRDLPSPDKALADFNAKKQIWDDALRENKDQLKIWVSELHFLGAEYTLSSVRCREKNGGLASLDEIPCEVQILSIGDTRIAVLPGEIYAEFGITIQYRSGFEKCFVIELGNGSLPGYVCTAKSYAEGGYEAGTSMMTENSGEQLVEAAVRLIKKTRADR